MGEHAMLDGSTVYQLELVIKNAIYAHKPDPDFTTNLRITPEEYPMDVTPGIVEDINVAYGEWSDHVSTVDYGYIKYEKFGSAYLKKLKCNPISAYEVVLQLAARMLYGENLASWQAINMSHYHGGRTELIQVLTEPMAKFCDLASSEKIPMRDCRELFFDAVKMHDTQVFRCQAGHGYDRTITSMEHLAVDQGVMKEDMPIWYSEEVWRKTRPALRITGNTFGLHSEAAAVLRNEKALWIVYDIVREE
jgi:hypothetical protein